MEDSTRRMWKELIKDRLRADFQSAMNTLVAAGCDEKEVFLAATNALIDLLAETVNRQGLAQRRYP